MFDEENDEENEDEYDEEDEIREYYLNEYGYSHPYFDDERSESLDSAYDDNDEYGKEIEMTFARQNSLCSVLEKFSPLIINDIINLQNIMNNNNPNLNSINQNNDSIFFIIPDSIKETFNFLQQSTEWKVTMKKIKDELRLENVNAVLVSMSQNSLGNISNQNPVQGQIYQESNLDGGTLFLSISSSPCNFGEFYYQDKKILDWNSSLNYKSISCVAYLNSFGIKFKELPGNNLLLKFNLVRVVHDEDHEVTMGHDNFESNLDPSYFNLISWFDEKSSYSHLDKIIKEINKRHIPLAIPLINEYKQERITESVLKGPDKDLYNA